MNVSSSFWWKAVLVELISNFGLCLCGVIRVTLYERLVLFAVAICFLYFISWAVLDVTYRSGYRQIERRKFWGDVWERQRTFTGSSWAFHSSFILGSRCVRVVADLA